MEEILKELNTMDQFNSKKEEYLSNQQEIKEEKKQLEKLHEKLELTLLGSNDRENAQKDYDDKKAEVESKENEASENNKKIIEEFEEQKTRTIETIDLEMSKYKKKEEIDALISQKNAYAKMAENSKKGIERMIADINEGKDIDHSFSLKMERESLQVNSKKAEELDAEIQGYKVLEDNEKTFSDLTYLRTRMQGMNFDNIKSVKEDPFFREYGKEQLEMEEAFKKELEEAQQRKEEREEEIKGMNNEEFAKWYTGDPNKEITFEKQERFDPEKIKNMSKEEFKEHYTGKGKTEEPVKPVKTIDVIDVDRQKQKERQRKNMFTLKNNNVDIKISKIFIDENSDKMKIFLKNENGIERSLELEGKIEDILNNKKDVFKETNIYKECAKIAGSRFKGYLLRRKVNPVIITLMGSLDDKQSIKSYLKAINDKQEVDFDMVHDMRNSKLSFKNRRLMKRCAKVEEQSLGISVFKDDNKLKLLASKAKKVLKNQPKKYRAERFIKREPNKEKTFNEGIRVSDKVIAKTNEVSKNNIQNKEKAEMDKATDKIIQDVKEIMQKGEDR